jgi:phosphoglycerate dehydrogenase-like enzyme
MICRLRKRLPDWCRFRLADPRQPLEAQVSNAAVLVPAAARITRDVIESAKNLRVIIQPAAGERLCVEKLIRRPFPAY